MKQVLSGPMLFDGSEDLGAPPAPDEVEVTVIGPGYGEAVLVHVGDGRWLIVDSCIVPGDPKPAPQRYLEAIGVSCANVFCVAASHWDDDHVKGLRRLLEACSASDFLVSKAFQQRDFHAYAEAYNRPLTKFSRPGTRELRDVFEYLMQSGRSKLLGAFPNRRVYGAEDFTASHGEPIEVWTLSPSDQEYDNFLKWVLENMPHAGETRRLSMRRIRNDLSMVVLVTIGQTSILLGGDLEEEGRPETGWSAILASSGRPSHRASLFKVPHHGSPTGHHDEIWSTLLTQDPVAVVAPFKHGKHSIPSTIDVDRITKLTPHSYSTTSFAGRAQVRRNNTVEKTIKEATVSFAAIPQVPGLVRLRRRILAEPSWRAETFGGACGLATVYA